MPEKKEALKQMLEGLLNSLSFIYFEREIRNLIKLHFILLLFNFVGINFIHSQKFVHRDVKPNNILISQSGGLKIADFGFCKPVKGIDQFSMSAAGVGTGGWMAPELLWSITNFENGGKAAAHATTAIDVFPLGCVFFYYMTKGIHPFGNALDRNKNIFSGNYDLSSTFEILILVFLELHP